MNESFNAALDRALKGDKAVLAGLGIEEQLITSPLWDDRVSVDGAGVVTFTSRRPSGDQGGAAIGVFRSRLEKEELKSLLQALRKLAAAPPSPARSEAYETRILISAVAAGHLFGVGAPAFPPALEPLQPVLTPLSAAMGKAMQAPVRSLRLVMELPEGVVRSGVVPVVVHLINDGTEGFWVSSPSALPNKPDRDRVELVYAAPIVFMPGVSPVPVPPKKILLSARDAAADGPAYLWIPPKGDVPVLLQAKFDGGNAKELVFRAELHVEEGPEAVAGQPHLRGTVFSPDVTAQPK